MASDKRNAPPELLDALRARFGNRFSTSEDIRARHGKGESYHACEPPDGVVFAHSTDDVQAAVKLCAAHGTPVIPFGTGTSLEGHVAARQGGISIDVAEMQEVVEVNADDLDCRVQAGVTRKALNDHLRDTGLMFPIDPGADASLGGMAATRASGTNAVRYGTMRENVLGLTVVLATGEVIRTGGRARKSASGYDLTRLFVGSEGTLGVITEVQLRLHGIPEAQSAAVCAFADMHGAAQTAMSVIQWGIPVARMELLDADSIRGLNQYNKMNWPEQPTIFFEFHGSEAGVKEQAETTQGIAEDNGGSGFQWTTNTEERNRLWQARHDALYSTLSLVPGSQGWATDVCVPISALADCIIACQEDAKASDLTAPLVGHVGDGNFHLLYLIQPDDDAAFSRAKEHSARMVERALACGGTATGEHGVGYGKISYLTQEHGEGAIDAMRAIKQALDPENLMNPAKIFTT